MMEDERKERDVMAMGKDHVQHKFTPQELAQMQESTDEEDDNHEEPPATDDNSTVGSEITDVVMQIDSDNTKDSKEIAT
jgi:hypothetical protein